jgi:hypothetical protein
VVYICFAEAAGGVCGDEDGVEDFAGALLDWSEFDGRGFLEVFEAVWGFAVS